MSPQSGPLAGFAEADAFTVERAAAAMAEKGLAVEIIVRDSPSNPSRASEGAQELVVDDEVHPILVGSTPETTNPAAPVAENEGVPCIATKAPGQPRFIGQQGNPGDPAPWRPFDCAFHDLWGLEDAIGVVTAVWSQLETHEPVGGLFPDDADGNAWGDPRNGVAPGFAAAGCTTVDPGRFQNRTDDVSVQVNAFRAANAEIVTGLVILPDFRPSGTRPSSRASAPRP